MKLLYYFTVLLLPFITLANDCHHNEHHCLSHHTLSYLTTEYLHLRSLSPSSPLFPSLLKSIITHDAIFEDETISYFTPPGGIGQTGPYARSRNEYFTSRKNGEVVSTTTVPKFTIQEGLVRFSCDSITLRWISSAVVNKVVPFSNATIGDSVVYKGIDLVNVNAKKRKIETVHTSADYIREIKQKGFPLS